MCPKSYELLRSRGRNAWTLPSCLSTKPQPEIVEFDSAGLLGGIINQNIEKKPGDGGGSENRETIKMQCVPLYSVLLALGKYHSLLNFNFLTRNDSPISAVSLSSRSALGREFLFT